MISLSENKRTATFANTLAGKHLRGTHHVGVCDKSVPSSVVISSFYPFLGFIFLYSDKVIREASSKEDGACKANQNGTCIRDSFQRGPRGRGREAAPGQEDTGEGSSRRAPGPGKAPCRSKVLKHCPREFFRLGNVRFFSLGATDNVRTNAVKKFSITSKEISLYFRQKSLFFPFI